MKMSRKDRTSSEASLRAKCLIMSDLQIPHSRVRGKSDLHNYRPEEKNTNGPILLSSTPLPHSLYLHRILSSCSLSLSFRHPSFISILFPDSGLVSYHPSFRWEEWRVWSFSFLFLHQCVIACPCVHMLCGFVCALVMWLTFLKWYGRQRGLVRWSNQPATR